jgi:hypothetical protein
MNSITKKFIAIALISCLTTGIAQAAVAPGFRDLLNSLRSDKKTAGFIAAKLGVAAFCAYIASPNSTRQLLHLGLGIIGAGTFVLAHRSHLTYLATLSAPRTAHHALMDAAYGASSRAIKEDVNAENALKEGDEQVEIVGAEMEGDPDPSNVVRGSWLNVLDQQRRAIARGDRAQANITAAAQLINQRKQEAAMEREQQQAALRTAERQHKLFFCASAASLVAQIILLTTMLNAPAAAPHTLVGVRA